MAAKISSIVPIVVIVGPTGSGKSALALELARSFNGEIICADSRTVYNGMDVGTAKPSNADQTEIKHYGLDVTTPDMRFTAADFKELTNQAIVEISSRNKLPIMVGGTGLYIDGVLFDYQFLPPAPEGKREELETKGIDALREELKLMGAALPINELSPRHLIRAIETEGQTPAKAELRQNTLVIGIEINKVELQKRLEQRIDTMFAAGLLNEVTELAEKYGWENEAMTGVGYRECRKLLEGTQSLEETKKLILTHSLQYAKRQLTWFKRHQHIHWVSSVSEAKKLVEQLLMQ